MISAGSDLTIHSSQVDTHPGDGITEDEITAYLEGRDLDGVTSLQIDGLRPIDVTGLTAEQLKEKIRQQLTAGTGENVIPKDQAIAELPNANRYLNKFFGEAQAAQQAYAEAQASGQNVEAAKTAFEEAKARLQSQIRLVQRLNGYAENDRDMGINASMFSLADMSPDGGTGAKATFAMTSEGGAGTGASAQTVGGGGASSYLPGTWGSSAFDGMKGFTTSAYENSMMAADSALNSFDSVLQNQNKGKQLMMLFFYFARMAESGDLGAMYQFMKFLTYIISKDKSKQQIDMGKKLIELQDLSRQWTDKLLNMQTNSADPEASNNFMKMMTQVKSETDAIATSQKLISQMMEEFAQIVETLTNATKGALEAQGRVMRVTSQIRG